MNMNRGRLTLLIFTLSTTCGANAQTYTYETHSKQVSLSASVSPLPNGFGQLGETIDFNTGSLSFKKTIVEIPGNNSLRVAADYEFAIWDRLGWYSRYELRRAVPYIVGIHSYDHGWVVGGPSNYTANRCSDPARKSVAAVIRSTKPPRDNFIPDDYWDGNSLMGVEGGGIIRPIDQNELGIQGVSATWATNGGWRFSCYLLPDGSEGFVGHAKNGDKYFFGTPERGPDSLWIMSNFRPDAESWIDVSLYKMHLRRIEDKFGNWVNYEQDRIVSSDGRIINFYPDRVEANGKQWLLTYLAGPNGTGVPYSYTITNPDNTRWSVSSSNVISSPSSNHDSTCTSEQSLTMSIGGETTLAVTAESGITGTFKIRPKRRGFSHVPYQCMQISTPGPSYANTQDYVDEPALVERTISGPGIEPLNHVIDYGPVNACYETSPATSTPDPCSPSSPDYRTVTVTGSDGTSESYTYGNRYLTNAGLLLKHKIGNLQETTYEYATPYQNFNGIGKRRIYNTQDIMVVITKKRVIKRDGVNFTWSIANDCGIGAQSLCIDSLYRATKIITSSSNTP